MKRFIYFLFLAMTSSSFGQKNISYAKGSFFIELNTNKLWYGASKLHFQNNNDDFELTKLKAKDKAFDLSNQGKELQFGFKFGAYIANHWAIQLGLDHFNYRSVPNQYLQIQGNSFLGSHQNEAIALDSLSYFNHKINYLHVGTNRGGRLIAFDRRAKYLLTSNVGADFGFLLSSSENNYEKTLQKNSVHMSGFAANLSLGINFEIQSRFFIGLAGLGGYQFQSALKADQQTGRIKQNYPFGMLQAKLGFFFYSKNKDHCNTCPQW